MLFSEFETRLAGTTFPPVVAYAAWVRGRLVGADNKGTEAIEHFKRAYLVSIEHSMDKLGAKAASSIGFYYAESRDFEHADHYLTVAGALAKACGSAQVQAGVAGNLVALRMRQSRYDDALEAARRGLTLVQSQSTPRPISVAEAYVSLAKVLRVHEGPKAATATLLKAREYVLDELGSTHPILVDIYSAQGTAASEVGEYDEAFVHSTAAVEQARAAYGEGSLEEAYELANLATIAGNLGRKRQALDMLARVDEVLVAEQGANHPIRAVVMNNRAALFAELEEWEKVEAEFAGALRITVANADGPDALSVKLRRNLALVSIYADDLEKAREYAEAALAEGVAIHGESHMDTAGTHALLGRIALERDDFASARVSLQRAADIGHDSPSDAAGFHFYLARALVEDPASTAQDRRKGLSLARAAEKVLATATDVESTHTAVADWLKEYDQGFSPG